MWTDVQHTLAASLHCLIHLLHQKLCGFKGYTGLLILAVRLVGTVWERILKFFQSANDLLNMDPYVGDVFLRKLHAFLSECWNDKFHLPFIEKIIYGKPSVGHDFIIWTEVFQEPWICSHELITACSSIYWWDEHDESTWCNCNKVFDGVLAIVVAVGLISQSRVKIALLLKGCFWTVDDWSKQPVN